MQGTNTGSATTTLNTAYAYGYNAAGWITGTTTISGTDTLTHDGAGRLTSDCGQQPIVRNTADHCYRWTYDKNDNVTSQVNDNGSPEAYTYSPTQPNAVVHTTSLQATVPVTDRYRNTDTYYAYDGNGDTTAITSPVNGAYTDTAAINTRIQYDAEQRPITVTKLATVNDNAAVPLTVTLAYNADGLRDRYTARMSGTVTLDEQFRYRDGELASVSGVTATLNGDGSVKSQGAPYTDTFVYGALGEPLELLRQQGGATARYWYALDGEGSVVAVTDATGAVADRYTYDSWGEQEGRYREGLADQQIRYRGYWYDSELGWYWVTTRHYDPEVLRWLQPDPSDIDGVHTYAYVGDDPVDFADPSGLDDIGIIACGQDVKCIQRTEAQRAHAGDLWYAAYQFFFGDYVDTIRNNPDPKAKAAAAAMLILAFLPPTRVIKIATIAPKVLVKLVKAVGVASRAHISDSVADQVVRIMLKGKAVVRTMTLGRKGLTAAEVSQVLTPRKVQHIFDANSHRPGLGSVLGLGNNNKASRAALRSILEDVLMNPYRVRRTFIQAQTGAQVDIYLKRVSGKWIAVYVDYIKKEVVTAFEAPPNLVNNFGVFQSYR